MKRMIAAALVALVIVGGVAWGWSHAAVRVGIGRSSRPPATNPTTASIWQANCAVWHLTPHVIAHGVVVCK